MDPSSAWSLTPPVSPLEVDHHRTAVHVVYLHEYVSNAHTSIVFMLFNLTSIWNLSTISIGGRERDGVPSLVGPGA
jgi:hypothetical protein